MIPACVFAKPPEPGKVKTRLAPALGTAGACELAAAMLRDVWEAVAECPSVVPILATVELGAFPIHVTPDRVWLQGDGDLGAKLERIMQRALASHPAALAIGADTPLLAAPHLETALASLKHHDAVIGRCTDGGFYLLGLTRCPAGLFDALPWSTSSAASAMTTRLEEHGLDVAEIETLFDVDVPEDLNQLSAALAASPSAARHTRACVSASLSRR